MRLVDLKGHVELPLLPVASETLGLFCAESEENRPELVERQSLRIADCAKRGGVHARDGNESDRAARDDRLRRFRLEPRNIGDDNAGLIDEPQFERKRLPPERRSERGPAKELRNDDGDEAPFSPRETPDVLEDGIEGPILPGNHLEMGGAFEPAEEAGPDAGIAASHGDVNRVEVPAGDLACVPNRLFGRGIETLDVDDDLVRRLAAGENGRAARTKPPPDSSGSACEWRGT